jgi:hypothetical protein
MFTINRNPQRAIDSELERVIEPLASYICAADQPRAILNSVLALLRSEVEQTNRTASAQVAVFSEGHWS